MSSSSSATINPLIGNTVSEKLNKLNHALWKAQVLAVIRGARLEGHLTGTSKPPAATKTEKQGDKEVILPNPEYADWFAADQQVLAYLLGSLSKEVLSQVVACNTTAKVWAVIQSIYSSMTRARSINTRIALATLKKGTMTIAEYIGKARTLADEMAFSGKPIDDDELISYIFIGLDSEYDSVVSALLARTDPLTVGDVYSNLLSHEQRMELQHGTRPDAFANLVNRGHGSQHGCDFGRGRGGAGNRGRGRAAGNNSRQHTSGHRNNNTNEDRPQCQLCKKFGHEVIDCWHRFEENFVANSSRYAGLAANSYGVDTNWYTDTGATDHVTGELEKLTVHDKYKGQDQIHTASGAGSGHEENAP